MGQLDDGCVADGTDPYSLGPFDEGDPVLADLGLQKARYLALQAFLETVEIDVGDRSRSPLVALGDRERGTRNSLDHPEAPEGPSRERRLAGPEVAYEQHDVAWPESVGKFSTEYLGLPA